MHRVFPFLILLCACKKSPPADIVLPQSSNPARVIPQAASRSDAVSNETETRKVFRLAETMVRVHDARMSRDLSKLLENERADVVINGGFFDLDSRALGLAMSEGKLLSRPNHSGGILTVSEGHATLHDASTFVMPESPTGFGIQCLPRLVVAGAVNIRKSDEKRAERIALCVRDKGTAIEIWSVRSAEPGGGPTLFDLATKMQHEGCEDALNLDGGPSAGIAYRDDSGIHQVGPRGPVRHAISFSKKP